MTQSCHSFSCVMIAVKSSGAEHEKRNHFIIITFMTIYCSI